MYETPQSREEGALRPMTEGEAPELVDEGHAAHRAHVQRAASERVLRANLAPEHGVTWVRVSDLISSGTGRIAGRGIDFEAELARRLRHPVDATRQAIRDRRSALPPLDVFGRSRARASHDALGRS